MTEPSSLIPDLRHLITQLVGHYKIRAVILPSERCGGIIRDDVCKVPSIGPRTVNTQWGVMTVMTTMTVVVIMVVMMFVMVMMMKKYQIF